MNATVKAVSQHPLASLSARGLLATKQTLICLLLVVAILVSAFSLVYVKDKNRRLFSEVDILQQQHEQYQAEWTQLLLEQGAWSTQARVQRIAQSHLSFVFPSRRDITIIRY